ncbi:MAG: carbon-phosphorus lyase complex subunit PhnI [Deltaproteobacteria bacterium]|nr:carbon-phosphorus lyase complex subunit PhnI [Deltaproteobacteria bacterium]
MYVAVKGGQKAIEAAHRLLDEARRGDPSLPELDPDQIRNQLGLAVDRVQAEGSLYDPGLAARAVKQAMGDLVEAVFLLRAARATLERFGYSEPLRTGDMQPRRRVSGTFKDLPGGQILGPTFDYTHRLLKAAPGAGGGSGSKALPPDGQETPPPGAAEAKPAEDGAGSEPVGGPAPPPPCGTGGGNGSDGGPDGLAGRGVRGAVPGAASFLESQGLIETEEGGGEETPFDLTRTPLEIPQDRPGRLQALARADEGFLLALAYSSQRGYGSVHPFVADLRLGTVEVEFDAPELGFPVTVGEIEVTECQAACQFKGGGGKPPMFTRGYGLVVGHNERKCLSMAIVDRALRSRELGEAVKGPAQDEEFVLYHGDNVEASGFVSHIKLPHYVDFQAELAMLRHMRSRAGPGGDEPLAPGTCPGQGAGPGGPKGQAAEGKAAECQAAEGKAAEGKAAESKAAKGKAT